MSVTELNPPLSGTEAERQRFERWVMRAITPAEATNMLARTKGGNYVLGTARAGWAARQARGWCDAEKIP